jgi:hypothetical protein
MFSGLVPCCGDSATGDNSPSLSFFPRIRPKNPRFFSLVGERGAPFDSALVSGIVTLAFGIVCARGLSSSELSSKSVESSSLPLRGMPRTGVKWVLPGSSSSLSSANLDRNLVGLGSSSSSEPTSRDFKPLWFVLEVGMAGAGLFCRRPNKDEDRLASVDPRSVGV